MSLFKFKNKKNEPVVEPVNEPETDASFGWEKLDFDAIQKSAQATFNENTSVEDVLKEIKSKQRETQLFKEKAENANPFEIKDWNLPKPENNADEPENKRVEPEGNVAEPEIDADEPEEQLAETEQDAAEAAAEVETAPADFGGEPYDETPIMTGERLEADGGPDDSVCEAEKPPCEEDDGRKKKKRRERQPKAPKEKKEKIKKEKPEKQRSDRDKIVLFTPEMTSRRRRYMTSHLIFSIAFLSLTELASLAIGYFFYRSKLFSLPITIILVMLSALFAAACVFIFVRYLKTLNFEYDMQHTD